jgi:flagellar biosynthetic protein FlhB
VWGVLRTAWPEVAALPQQSPRALLEVVQRYGVRMLTNAGLAYVALAAADYGWQLWQHEQSLRMTKEEVKQENKNSEGDPMVKSRQRALGRQRARQQMFRDVPTRRRSSSTRCTSPWPSATTPPSPRALRGGRGPPQDRRAHQAARLRRSGARGGERPARPRPRRHREGRHDDPAELYVAVAEVLAFVIRQRQKPALARDAA